MPIGTEHLHNRSFWESANADCTGYFLMDLFPLKMMLALVAVQCETPEVFFFFFPPVYASRYASLELEEIVAY